MCLTLVVDIDVCINERECVIMIVCAYEFMRHSMKIASSISYLLKRFYQ